MSIDDNETDSGTVPDPQRVGAVSVRGRPVRRAPLGWLPWVALALAALLALVMLVVALSG